MSNAKKVPNGGSRSLRGATFETSPPGRLRRWRGYKPGCPAAPVAPDRCNSRRRTADAIVTLASRVAYAAELFVSVNRRRCAARRRAENAQFWPTLWRVVSSSLQMSAFACPRRPQTRPSRPSRVRFPGATSTVGSTGAHAMDGRYGTMALAEGEGWEFAVWEKGSHACCRRVVRSLASTPPGRDSPERLPDDQ